MKRNKITGTQMKPLPGNKSRILFLQSYLEEHTDDDHVVTTEELISIYAANGFRATRQTIADDVKILNASGFDVIVNSVKKNKTKTNAYHIGSRLFELPELKLMIDAVASSQFITAKKSDVLVKKLATLTNAENRDELRARIYTADRLKTSNPGVLVTIDTIYRAISNHHKISFCYWDYSPSKRKVLRNNGKQYIASPYALIWNDDRYYAVSYSDKHEMIINFRVDRMRAVEETEIPAIIDEKFNPIEHCKSMINMYYDGMEETTVHLRCQNDLMKNVIDQFGEKIKTRLLDSEHFEASVCVVPSSTFFGWVVQYNGGIQITGPMEVKKRYEEMLREILKGQIAEYVASNQAAVLEPKS